jgi:hypothetical protein
MAIKIENRSQTKLSTKTEKLIEQILNGVPREHTRGLERLRLVDAIEDPRLRTPQRSNLPGLYHPRQGTQQAWLEVALGVLLPKNKSLFKRLFPRLSFKGNLAAVIFSLIGQHYYLTMRHSVKKTQLEAAVRAYTESRLRAWSEQQHTLRTRLFRPLQPTLERWARALQKRAATERKKTSSTS